MAIHSGILAWKIPWTEKPGGYNPWGRKESNTTEQLILTYKQATIKQHFISLYIFFTMSIWILLLLSHLSCVRLCATP